MKLTRVWHTSHSVGAKVLPWVVFACLAAAMLFDPGRDTFGIASAAFAASLGMAAVTFSYARTLKDGLVRDELVFAGERLLTGGVLFLVSSILRYASHDIPRYANAMFRAVPPGQPPDVALFRQNGLLGLIIAVAAFMFFLTALIYAQMGVGILTAVTSHRAKRRHGPENYFALGKAVENRVATLDQADQDAGNGTHK